MFILVSINTLEKGLCSNAPPQDHQTGFRRKPVSYLRSTVTADAINNVFAILQKRTSDSIQRNHEPEISMITDEFKRLKPEISCEPKTVISIPLNSREVLTGSKVTHSPSVSSNNKLTACTTQKRVDTGVLDSSN